MPASSTPATAVKSHTIGGVRASIATRSTDGAMLGRQESGRSTVDENERDELFRRAMARSVTEKAWRVPGDEGARPGTLPLRVTEVPITDSDARFIFLSP